MSLAQFIKDFVESINDFYGSFYGSTEYSEIFKFTFFYLLKSFQFLAQYIITFRWFNDFCFLKVSIPRIMYSSFMDNPIFDDPSRYLFNFFDTPNFTNSPFFIGIINSCLFSLPISANQILLLRRVTVEGVYAGAAAGLGLVVGQLLFLFCIIFGFRFIIFSWLSAEFLHYLMGLILTLSAVYVITNKPIRRIRRSETKTLKDLFIFHICLTWTEQTTFFPYFSNISFSPEPTIFEILNSQAPLNAILEHWSYSCGLMTGSVLLTLFFGCFIFWLGYAVSSRFNFSYSRWVRTVHYSSIVTLVAFSLTSFGYYSFDYITSGSLGFIPDDDALRGFHIKTTSRDFKKGRLGEYSSHTSLDTDATPFNRGRYLTGSEVELTFEDLNYQGEYIWRSRNDRLTLGSPGLINKLIKRFFPNLKAKLSTMRPGFNFSERAQRKLLEQQKKEQQEREQEELDYEDLDDEDLDDEDLDDEEIEINDEDIESLDIYDPMYGHVCDQEEFIFRFIEDYQVDTHRSTAPDFYHDVGHEPFSAVTEFSKYGFDSFAYLEDIETDEFEDTLGKRLKVKYYANWVYKLLLSIDFIDFLNKQPKKYSITAEEEYSLFNRRLLLANYYDSLLGYLETPYTEDYEHLFIGSKSYANKVYNQQFAGTLKVIRKLFSIGFDENENLNKKAILKYDQTLFKEQKDEQNPLRHEEINNDLDFDDDFDFDNDEQLFFTEATSTPFYAGWDMKSRKFLITNYLSTRANVYKKIKKTRALKNSKNVKKTMPKRPKKSRRIRFIAWPLNNSKIEEIKDSLNYRLNLAYSTYSEQTQDPQKDIFEYSDVDESDNGLIYETLPSFLKRVELRDKDKSIIILQPLKGGFAWSGNEPLNTELQEKIQKLLDYIPKFKGLRFKIGL